MSTSKQSAESNSPLSRHDYVTFVLLGVYCTLLFSSPSKLFALGQLTPLASLVFFLAFGLRSRKQLVWSALNRFARIYVLLLLVFGGIVFFHGFAADDAFRGFVYFFKFAAIAFLCFLCISARVGPSLIFELALFVFVFNVIGIALGIFAEFALGQGALLWRGLDGRISTFLNLPGMLWKSGFMVLPGLAYLYLYSSRLIWLVFSCLAAMLVSLDGSRTGFVFVFLLLVVFLPVYAISSGWCRGVALRSIVLFVMVAISLLLARPVVDKSVLGENTGVLSRSTLSSVVERFSNISEAMQKEETEAGIVQSNDHWRLEMLQVGLNRALDFPLIGDGIGSTSVMADHGAMVVHMSYLQVLGDYGIIGFVIFALLMIVPIYFALRRAPELVHKQFGQADKAGVFCVLVLVLSYPLYGLLHPLSNELSEWAPFVVAFAVLVNIVSGRKRNSCS